MGGIQTGWLRHAHLIDSDLHFHPRVEIGVDAGVIRETDAPTTTHGLDEEPSRESDRAEPDIEVYADVLLLIDALERHDLTVMTDLETGILIDLYTLLSDVQRGANDLRQDVADVLLNRVQHGQPVASPVRLESSARAGTRSR